MSMSRQVRAYYLLTKPGIVRGNAIHVLAGAFFASSTMIQWTQILAVLLGTSLVIASACVANNYLDRSIDARMKRTKKRPSVTGEVSVRSALIYMALLVVVGFVTLYLFTNLWVVAIGVVAYVMYVFVYGWAKRNTIHSTLVGAVPGALPVMAGYVAVYGSITLAAWLLFILVLVWQMPHFYAISLFRKAEYREARLPVMGAVKPFAYVRAMMIGYILLYIGVVTVLISLEIMTPAAGLLLMAGGAYWLYVSFRDVSDQVKWARSVFGASLILALGLFVASVLNVFVVAQS